MPRVLEPAGHRVEVGRVEYRDRVRVLLDRLLLDVGQQPHPTALIKPHERLDESPLGDEAVQLFHAHQLCVECRAGVDIVDGELRRGDGVGRRRALRHGIGREGKRSDGKHERRVPRVSNCHRASSPIAFDGRLDDTHRLLNNTLILVPFGFCCGAGL